MKETYLQRRTLMFDKIRNLGTQCVLLTNPSNIFYFTGIKLNPYERFVGLVLDSQLRKTYLLIPELEKGLVNDIYIEEWVYADEENSLEKLGKLIGACSGLSIEKKNINMMTGESLIKMMNKDANKCQIMGIDQLIDQQRLMKDSVEIDKISQAAKYTDEILEEVVQHIEVGKSEKQIKFDLLKEISEKAGVMCEAFDIQVCSGSNSAKPHGVSNDTMIQKGDSLVIDFGVVYQQYRSDITRTFFIGKPNKELETIYRVVFEAQKHAINQVVPGIPICEIDLAAREIIKQSGYGRFFNHRTGHGIGIDIHENPIISSINREVLQEGMVFTIEPGIYIPGLGGVRIEDDVAVTAKGGSVLTSYPKEFDAIILG